MRRAASLLCLAAASKLHFPTGSQCKEFANSESCREDASPLNQPTASAHLTGLYLHACAKGKVISNPASFLCLLVTHLKHETKAKQVCAHFVAGRARVD